MAKRESSYVRLERSREFRLWFTQVGVPLVATVLYIKSNPEVDSWVTSKVESMKTKVKNIFKK